MHEIGDEKTASHEAFDRKDPWFAKNMQTWGEAGVVTAKSLSTPENADHGASDDVHWMPR